MPWPNSSSSCYREFPLPRYGKIFARCRSRGAPPVIYVWTRRKLRGLPVGNAGQRIPLAQIGKVEVRMEDPLLRRRDRTPTITVRGDIADNLQPPDVSAAIMKQLQPIVDSLPDTVSIWRARLRNRAKPLGRWRLYSHYDRPDAAGHHSAGTLHVGHGDGVSYRSAGAGRRGPCAAAFNQPFGINARSG